MLTAVWAMTGTGWIGDGGSVLSEQTLNHRLDRQIAQGSLILQSIAVHRGGNGSVLALSPGPVSQNNIICGCTHAPRTSFTDSEGSISILSLFSSRGKSSGFGESWRSIDRACTYGCTVLC